MSNDPQRTILLDVEMPFLRMVVLFIKIGLAWIPAVIILSILIGATMVLLGGLFGGIGMMFGGDFMKY